MDESRVTGAANETVGKAQATFGSALGDAKTEAEGRLREASGVVENLVGQAKDKVRDVADQAGDYAGQARDGARALADRAQDYAGQAYDTGRRYLDEGRRRYPEVDRYARDGGRAVASRVEENPLAAMLVAGALGYLLAVLIHRR